MITSMFSIIELRLLRHKNKLKEIITMIVSNGQNLKCHRLTETVNRKLRERRIGTTH